jgi:preprotein translocase subunit SecG
MENVVLTVHLLLALGLIGVVLLQRSEGGGLGLGGGGGGGGIMSGRSAASALSKVTWILAVAFIITSLGLTVLPARNSVGSSVVDSIGISDTAEENLLAPLGDSESLLPPTENSDSPLVPSAD